MKKFSFIVAAAAALVFASCGNKTQATDESTDTISFEQAQIEEKIMVELDSIADEWGKLKPVEGVMTNGKITLSDEEIKAKPEYLLDIAETQDLSLLSQKYRALGMLVVDMNVAKLYNMDVEAYKAAISKIATDVNDPAVNYKDESTAEDVKAMYVAEKENGRINLFWEQAAAVVVEQLYVISQNTEKFLPAFDDESASNLTYHIALVKLALDDLATYDNNIKGLVEVLAPLNELNAISVDQLKEQLEKMKPQIETARASLLK
ncbi:MAG: hypothetical protein KBT34_11675 [Prevotella sp.]|nr:hypothetical protein [Candidatus Prevotella equi]